MSEHVTLQYDGEKLTNFIIYVGDMSGLEPYYKAEFEYSGDRIAESRGYSYSGSTPVLDVTKTFSYNSSGQIATALQDTHDGNLVRAEYTYLDGTSNTYQLITPTHLKAYNLPLYGRMSEDAQKRLKVMKTMSKVLPSIFWADLSN